MDKQSGYNLISIHLIYCHFTNANCIWYWKKYYEFEFMCVICLSNVQRMLDEINDTLNAFIHLYSLCWYNADISTRAHVLINIRIWPVCTVFRLKKEMKKFGQCSLSAKVAEKQTKSNWLCSKHKWPFDCVSIATNVSMKIIIDWPKIVRNDKNYLFKL